MGDREGRAVVGAARPTGREKLPRLYAAGPVHQDLAKGRTAKSGQPTAVP